MPKLSSLKVWAGFKFRILPLRRRRITRLCQSWTGLFGSRWDQGRHEVWVQPSEFQWAGVCPPIFGRTPSCLRSLCGNQTQQWWSWVTFIKSRLDPGFAQASNRVRAAPVLEPNSTGGPSKQKHAQRSRLMLSLPAVFVSYANCLC